MSVTEAGIGVESHAFSPDDYQAMLAEVREHLPLFLAPAASERHDPVGDVEGLTGLHPEDLRRVIATHLCLSEAVSAFIGTLPQGLRRPVMSSVRPREVTQAVRGPVDWSATVRARAGSGADPTLFVVRPGRRIFDTPENRAVAWALRELEVAALRALRLVAGAGPSGTEVGWQARLSEVLFTVRRAWRVEWLREVTPQRPDARTLQRLAATRSAFYRVHVGRVVRTLLAAQQPSAQALVKTLCERYFVPDKAWRLFEVMVALRLARAFAHAAGGPRLARLLVGADGTDPYARYQLHDGDQVQLVYQGWPAAPGASRRWMVAKRHGFHPGFSQPDLTIRRTGAQADCIVLELKATRSPSYLGAGLSQLLGYLSDRADLFGPTPAGWLVAPASDAFRDAAPVPGDPLWVVSADEVASAAVARLGAA
ncbi:hypothetical protein [Candidatus Solirubrobacter pratensis]|uniref:hypothetical protein n=1 Tax=Candidatus Solirubrobacter pratensis TaxID=1298857 RepID=UPI00048932D0|nr:hypothetical protein [Candidatus Solirubrobacter pratensis]